LVKFCAVSDLKYSLSESPADAPLALHRICGNIEAYVQLIAGAIC
jgi:hypothetical protein